MPILPSEIREMKRGYVEELSNHLAAAKPPDGALFLPFSSFSAEEPDRLAASSLATQVSVDRFLRRLWSELRLHIEETRGLQVPRITVDGIVSRDRKVEAVVFGDGRAGHIFVSLGWLQLLWAMNRWSILAEGDPSLYMPPTQEREHLQEQIYRNLIQVAHWFYSGTPSLSQWEYWRVGADERREVDFRTRSQVALVLLHEVAHFMLGHSADASGGWDEILAKEFPLLGAVGCDVDLEYKADLYALELMLSYVEDQYRPTGDVDLAHSAMYGFFLVLALLEEMCAGRRPGQGHVVTYKLTSKHPTFDERRKRVAMYLESRISASALQCMSHAESVVRYWLRVFDSLSGNLFRATMQLAIGSFAPLVLPPDVGKLGDYINPYRSDTRKFVDIYQP